MKRMLFDGMVVWYIMNYHHLRYMHITIWIINELKQFHSHVNEISCSQEINQTIFIIGTLKLGVQFAYELIAAYISI